MAFASCTTCARRVSKRDSAPENVNAISRPSSANTAVSSEPMVEPVEPKRVIARSPSPRPSRSDARTPTKIPIATAPPIRTGLMISKPFLPKAPAYPA